MVFKSLLRRKSSYVLSIALALSATQMLLSDRVLADEVLAGEPVNEVLTLATGKLSLRAGSDGSGNEQDKVSTLSNSTTDTEASQNTVIATWSNATSSAVISKTSDVSLSFVNKAESNLALGADASQPAKEITTAITLDDYRKASASEMTQWVRSGRVTGEQLLNFAFETIKQTNPELNNIISIREQEARKELSNLRDEGQPFYQIPLVVKGLGHLVAGGQNTQGLALLNDQTSRTTSTFVKQLQKLGFIVIGQSSFPQLGLINVTHSDLYGITRNPWDPSHNSGGSSGGASAAVSSGQVAIASASDGGGSTRIPASWSGLVGLHPTRGILEGNSQSLKNQVSHFVITKTVEDTKAVFESLLKDNLKDEQTSTVLSTNQVIAYTTKTPSGTPISPEAVKAVEEAVNFLNQQGFKTIEVNYPVDGKRMMMAYYTIVASGSSIADYLINQKLKRHLTMDDVELLTWSLYQTSQSLTREDVDAAWADVALLTEELKAFYSQYPIFLTPTTAYAAPEADYRHIPEELKEKMRDMSDLSKHERLELIYQQWLPAWTLTPFTQLANLTGTPSLTLPTHLTREGLPMGVLFNGAANQDRLLIQLGELFEKSRVLTTFKTSDKRTEVVDIPYGIQYLRQPTLPLGYKGLLQGGKNGQKELIFERLKQGLSFVKEQLVGEKLISEPQQMVYVIGTKIVADKPSIFSSQNAQKNLGLQPQYVTFAKESSHVSVFSMEKSSPKEVSDRLISSHLPMTGDGQKSSGLALLTCLFLLLGLFNGKVRSLDND